MIFLDMTTSEFHAVLNQLERILQPRAMALSMTAGLRREFRDQTSEAFASEGAPGSGGWVPLSDWRVADRGGSERPILAWTGSFADEVSRYKGETRLLGDEAFSYWYPAQREMSGRYWGLTAGQMVNPLGATPLASFPRRVLAGPDRATLASLEALAAYFTASGLPTEGL